MGQRAHPTFSPGGVAPTSGTVRGIPPLQKKARVGQPLKNTEEEKVLEPYGRAAEDLSSGRASYTAGLAQTSK